MTHVHPPTNTVSPETLERRCKETFEAAMKIHGGTISNKRPALDGLYHTISKKCKTSVLGDYVLSNSKVINYIIKQCKKNQLAEFECSKDNVSLSIATYYTSGVMGKRKYQAVRLTSSMKSSDAKRGGKTAIKFMPNCPIPKPFTYNSLVNEIKKIDVEKVYSMEEEFSKDIDDENINGCSRDLREYLP